MYIYQGPCICLLAAVVWQLHPLHDCTRGWDDYSGCITLACTMTILQGFLHQALLWGRCFQPPPPPQTWAQTEDSECCIQVGPLNLYLTQATSPASLVVSSMAMCWQWRPPSTPTSTSTSTSTSIRLPDIVPSCADINANGLNNPQHCGKIFSHLADCHCQVALLQETHSTLATGRHWVVESQACQAGLSYWHSGSGLYCGVS